MRPAHTLDKVLDDGARGCNDREQNPELLGIHACGLADAFLLVNAIGDRPSGQNVGSLGGYPAQREGL